MAWKVSGIDGRAPQYHCRTQTDPQGSRVESPRARWRGSQACPIIGVSLLGHDYLYIK